MIAVTSQFGDASFRPLLSFCVSIARGPAHPNWSPFLAPMSLRLVEEMLLERGIIVSYETIRRWGGRFGSAIHLSVSNTSISVFRDLKFKAPKQPFAALCNEVLTGRRADFCCELNEWPQRGRWGLAAFSLAARPPPLQRRGRRSLNASHFHKHLDSDLFMFCS